MRGALTPILVSIFTDCSVLTDWEGRAPVSGPVPSAPCQCQPPCSGTECPRIGHGHQSSPGVWGPQQVSSFDKQRLGYHTICISASLYLGNHNLSRCSEFLLRVYCSVYAPWPRHTAHTETVQGREGLAALRPNHSHLSRYSLADSEKRVGVWLWMFPEKDHYYHHLYFMFKYWSFYGFL